MAMTKKQREESAFAATIDEERNRIEARDKRQKEFWDGFKALDIAMRENIMTPIARIQGVVQGMIDEFDAGRASPISGCWKVYEYVGSFDMSYGYVGSVWTGEDEQTGEPIYALCGMSDSLDEVSLTEQIRKSLRAYLTAGAALAKRVGSPVYDDWIRLLMDITFGYRCSYYVFSRDYPFAPFYEKLENLHQRLWADCEAYRHLKELK